MLLIDRVKEQKLDIIRRHAQADDVKGSTQVVTTLGSLALLWWAALASVHVSYWLTGRAVPISLFTVRAFALMHECGHGSLFRTRSAQSRMRFSSGRGRRDAAVRVVAAS